METEGLSDNGYNKREKQIIDFQTHQKLQNNTFYKLYQQYLYPLEELFKTKRVYLFGPRIIQFIHLLRKKVHKIKAAIDLNESCGQIEFCRPFKTKFIKDFIKDNCFQNDMVFLICKQRVFYEGFVKEENLLISTTNQPSFFSNNLSKVEQVEEEEEDQEIGEVEDYHEDEEEATASFTQQNNSNYKKERVLNDLVLLLIQHPKWDISDLFESIKVQFKDDKEQMVSIIRILGKEKQMLENIANINQKSSQKLNSNIPSHEDQCINNRSNLSKQVGVRSGLSNSSFHKRIQKFKFQDQINRTKKNSSSYKS